MKNWLQAQREKLRALSRPQLLRAGAAALAAALSLTLTAVQASAQHLELSAQTSAFPPAADSASAVPSIDGSLYADLPDVIQTESAVRTEAVPYSIRILEDDSLYTGETQLVSPGADGLARITEELVYVNGVYDHTRLVETEILERPVQEVIREGTKYRPFSTGTYLWPAAGTLSSGFGGRSGFGSSNHKGLDIAGPTGTEVSAADAGLVIRADDEYSGYGNLIMIQHDNGDVTYYAHLSGFAVSAGEYVEQGQCIGYMGSTGVSSGSHLHFEIRLGGTEPVDPLLYLPA